MLAVSFFFFDLDGAHFRVANFFRFMQILDTAKPKTVQLTG